MSSNANSTDNHPVSELTWNSLPPEIPGVYVQWISPIKWDIVNVVPGKAAVLVGDGFEDMGLSQLPIAEYPGKWFGPIPCPIPD